MSSNPFDAATYSQALDLLAECYGEQIGLRFGQSTWTFGQIRQAVDLASRRLAALDLPRGSSIAIWLPNRPEFFWYWLGASQMGLLPVILNTRLKPMEAEYQLHQSKSVAVIVSGEGAFRDFLGDVLRMQEANTLGQGTGKGLPFLKSILSVDDTACEQTDIISLNRISPTADFCKACDADEGALVIYTSGTTGKPKGAILSHRVWAKAWDIAGIGYNDSNDCLYLGVPLFSSMAMLNGALPFWSRGGCVDLYERFDPEECLGAIKGRRITALHLLPAIISDMLALDTRLRDSLGSLRVGLALTNDPKVMAAAEDQLGIRSVVAGYGMTETMTLISRPLPDDDRQIRHTTQGHPLPNIELSIRDPETGMTLPADSEGEICVRGCTLMKGYFDKPAETAASLTDDGWFRTGDAGYLDKDGRVVFRHRLDNTYKSRGFNVSASEVEYAITEHPAVELVAVIDVPDPRDGACGVAFVIMRRGMSTSEQAILEFLKDRLSGYKQPKHIFFTEAFPTTAGTAKIQKHRLRELALDQISRI